MHEGPKISNNLLEWITNSKAKQAKRLMFSTDNNIDLLSSLLREVRSYLELKYEYTRLDISERLAKLASVVLLSALTLLLAAFAALFASIAAAYALEPLVGSRVGAFLIMAGLYALLIPLIFRFREKLILRPVIRVIVKILLSTDKEQTSKTS